ncbi:MAG: DUF58 domain-containing protein [Thermodesulfovibrionales bacterium]
MRLTWEGKRFLLAVFLIAVAAVNTGNNLIYLILSLMLAFLLLSLLLLRMNLSGLEASAFCSRPVFAGEPARILLTVRNLKRSLPSFSVRLAAGSGENAYFPRIGPDGTADADLLLTFRRRGVAGCRDFSFQSGFPFILMQMKKRARVSGSVLVYPAMAGLEGVLPRLFAAGESGAARVARSGDDLFGIRQFAEGDDWRNIHWKATARSGELRVSEFSVQESERVTVLLDNLAPCDEALFERAVSLAASLVRHFLEQGFAVRLASSGSSVGFGFGDRQLYRVLDLLALIAPSPVVDIDAAEPGTGFTVAVLTSGSSALAPLAASCGLVLHADSV